MIVWISNWAGGIVVSVILATIIEMILPNGKNKKYIKTVIGLFVLFSIIGPVISKFSGVSMGEFNLEMNIPASANSKEISSNNDELNKLYRTNLEKDIKEKLERKGYEVVITALSIKQIEGENYGKINQISLQVKDKKVDERILNNDTNKVVDIFIEEVSKVKIGSSENSNGLNKLEISEEIRKGITEYIETEYSVDKKNINVF